MAKRLHQLKNFAFAGLQSRKSRAGKISYLAHSGNQSEHRICFILPARRASHILIILLLIYGWLREQPYIIKNIIITG